MNTETKLKQTTQTYNKNKLCNNQHKVINKNKVFNKNNMNIEQKIQQTISKFGLFNKKEKVLVACSGGKDSTTALYILKKLGCNVEAITVDAKIGNYTEENLNNLKEFCKKGKIKIHIISFRKEFGHSLCALKSILHSKGFQLTSCTICGVLRRYLLNKYSRKLKASKIVTGHNLDDEAQSILMNLFKNNLHLLARLGPITGVTKDKKFIPRVKPLYFIPEKEIKAYSKAHNFPVKYSACPCCTDAFRNHIRQLLDNYEKISPGVKQNIVSNFIRMLPKLKSNIAKSNTRLNLSMAKSNTKLNSNRKTAKSASNTAAGKISSIAQSNRNTATGKINYCSYCKEPSAADVCMTCKLISALG